MKNFRAVVDFNGLSSPDPVTESGKANAAEDQRHGKSVRPAAERQSLRLSFDAHGDQSTLQLNALSRSGSPAATRFKISRAGCSVNFGLRSNRVPSAMARARPSAVRCKIKSRSNRHMFYSSIMLAIYLAS